MTTFPLEAVEKCTTRELQALQLERLRWSLAHAYENVARYRQKFDAAGVKPADVYDYDKFTPEQRTATQANLNALVANATNFWGGMPSADQLKPLTYATDYWFGVAAADMTVVILGPNNFHIRDRCVADPTFAAVQNVMIALACSASFHAAGV